MQPFHDGLMWHPLLAWLFFRTIQANALPLCISVPPSVSLTKPLLHKLCLSPAVALRQSVDGSAATGLGSEHSDREKGGVVAM